MRSAADGLAETLARLSSVEMVAALGLRDVAPWVRRLGDAAFTRASRPLGVVLARFDRDVGEHGIADAARATLRDLGAGLDIDGAAPPAGPLVVLANHPGAYDALALMAAVGRRDLAILAADLPFLRALPSLAPHLLRLPDDAQGRASAMRAALRHLRRGGALLHFGAGCIEPDPAFAKPHEALLAPWSAGTGALVRGALHCSGRVIVALVSGVHSARAKRLLVTRMAERRGVTTLAPLIQVALPGFRDVTVRIAMRESSAHAWLGGDDARVASEARGAMIALWSGSGDYRSNRNTRESISSGCHQ